MTTPTANYGWPKYNKVTETADPDDAFNVALDDIDVELKRVYDEKIAALTGNVSRFRGTMLGSILTATDNVTWKEVEAFRLPVTAGRSYFLSYHLRADCTVDNGDIVYSLEHEDAGGTTKTAFTAAAGYFAPYGVSTANPEVDTLRHIWRKRELVDSGNWEMGVQALCPTVNTAMLIVHFRAYSNSYLKLFYRQNGNNGTTYLEPGSYLEWRDLG